MLNPFAALAVACMLVPVGTGPLALANPLPNPPVQPDVNAAPLPQLPSGVVASAPPVMVTTPDGWDLTVGASDETQLAVAPLIATPSSREYLVAATFTGSVKGAGSTALAGGTLETGYQIGCGIALDHIKLNGSIGFGTAGSRPDALTPSGDTLSIQGQIEVEPKPGEVIDVPVTTKTFKDQDARVTLKDVHIKIDNCVGRSFLRSYAVLTSTTTDTDDVVAYYGIPQVV